MGRNQIGVNVSVIVSVIAVFSLFKHEISSSALPGFHFPHVRLDNLVVTQHRVPFYVQLLSNVTQGPLSRCCELRSHFLLFGGLLFLPRTCISY